MAMGLSEAAGRLRLDCVMDSSVAVVTVTGEIDVSTSALLREHLLRVITDEPHRSLVVHLAQVSFIDSTGTGVLVGIWHQVRATNAGLVLTAPRTRRSLFEAPGCAGTLASCAEVSRSSGRLYLIVECRVQHASALGLLREILGVSAWTLEGRPLPEPARSPGSWRSGDWQCCFRRPPGSGACGGGYSVGPILWTAAQYDQIRAARLKIINPAETAPNDG
jgi:anti-anti-sigma factor